MISRQCVLGFNLKTMRPGNMILCLEKIRFLFDVLLLEHLTLHRRGIFHSKHESSAELLKIHGTMFGEEQDSSHASKIYLGLLFVIQIKKRSPLMKHIAGQQTI